MIIFYVDESGNTSPHHEPLLDGETPLFCLSALALRSSAWREYDRRFLNLKRRYFPSEMASHAASSRSGRPEYYEVKGHELFKPSHWRHRERVFVWKLFELCRAQQAKFFAAIWRKDAVNPTNPQSMYTHSLQILAERFQLYCEASNEEGVIVSDSRTRTLNLGVATSYLSYVFGHDTGRSLIRLVEAPMFADSTLCAGLQLADIIGSCIYCYYYQRRCGYVPGLFDGDRLVLPGSVEASRDRCEARTPAIDYGHCRQYEDVLSEFQWRREGFVPGQTNFGYREVT